MRIAEKKSPPIGGLFHVGFDDAHGHDALRTALRVRSAGVAQRGDALVQRRMLISRRRRPRADAAADAERRAPAWAACSGRRFCASRSSAAIILSRPASVRAAGVGAELAMPREPHRDHAREQAEHHVAARTR